ncbi:MAG: hypothetical protein DRO00_08660 [Thermoproteota archaeon]|nr:MAG: hypothetical protein DRO00_08660 [Candidatus Korarchaeota archaeon]
MLHLVKYGEEKLEFIILVVTLPKRSSRMLWKTKIKEIDEDLKKDKNYYRVFKSRWIETKKEIERSGSRCPLVIIYEKGVEVIS